MLREHIEHLEESIDAGRQHETRFLRFEFHAKLITISARSQTIDLLNRLHNRARLVTTPPLPTSLPDAYHALLNALEAGDLIAAQRALQAVINPDF
jgi:DNA-binding GntR family transcriptional regulator